MSDVVLHIGMHKTGTTSIQHWLRDHESLLTEHGLRFPRGWLALNNHWELPLTLMRLDRASSPRRRGNEWRNVQWRADVLNQIRLDLARNRGKRTILSAEGLSLLRYDDEVIQLRVVVGDAHIVAYKREPADYLTSLAAFFVDNDIAPSSDPSAYNYLGPDAWHADFDTLAAVWRRYFSRVTVLSYEEACAVDGSVLPSFARLVGLPVTDVSTYRMNARGEGLARVEGNRRTNGLRFGEG